MSNFKFEETLQPQMQLVVIGVNTITSCKFTFLIIFFW